MESNFNIEIDRIYRIILIFLIPGFRMKLGIGNPLHANFITTTIAQLSTFNR